MRNPSRWLLPAAASWLFLFASGCQSPLKSTETADLQPPKSLLGEPFDADAARAKVAERRAASDELFAGNSADSAISREEARAAIAQAAQRTSAAGQTGAIQQTGGRRPPSPTPQTSEAIAQHIRLGSEAMSRQAWADATIHYEAILSADPQNPLAHQMLGRINDQTQKFDSAEYHYLRALSSRPQDPNLLSDLGFSYLQQGRLPDAKSYLLKALAIDAGHQMAKTNLAAVEAYLGNTDAALALLRQISSEEQAYQTLQELLSRPNPAVQRGQQLLSQNTDDLPIAEQMRLARETAQRERDRRKKLDELEQEQRIRQAMALGGPLSRMGRGVGDEDLAEAIARIESEERYQRPPSSGARSQQQQQQYPEGSYDAGSPQFGQPDQSRQMNQFGQTEQYNQGGAYNGAIPPGAAPQFGQAPGFDGQAPYNGQPGNDFGYGPSAQPQYPPSGNNQNWGNPNAFPQQNPMPSQGGWGSPDSAYDPQNSAIAPQQQMPPQQWTGQQQPQGQQWQNPPQGNPQWNQPGNPQWNQQQQQWNQQQSNQQQWSGPAPAQQSAPGNWQQQQWQSPPAQNPSGSAGPPLLNNLQQQNQQLWQQQQTESQFGAHDPSAAGGSQYQTFPNSQPQFAPPGQLPTPPPTSQPATGYGGNFSGNAQSPPADNSGVWNPQAAPALYNQQPSGSIQQLGHQTPADSGRGTGNPTGPNSMRDALRLGMAAGPGSLIQMNGQSAGSGQSQQPQLWPQQNSRQQTQPTNSSEQQYFPENAQPDAGTPSEAVWNSGHNPASQPSPTQNLWQSGPQPNAGQNAPPNSRSAIDQWQKLPAAQQQPQSSTWNHQSQQPMSPMNSQNWSRPQSAGNTWQGDSFGASPTTSSAFAPAHMLHPDPTQMDSASTINAGFDPQNSAGMSNASGTRVPWVTGR